MKKLVNLLFLFIFFIAFLHSKESFSIQSGRWSVRVDDSGVVAVSPGMGYRIGIASITASGSLDALRFKNELKKQLVPSSVMMNGDTPRLPFEVVIFEGDRKITGTVNNKELWNEMMGIILPKAYPNKADSVWRDYIEKYQAILPKEDLNNSTKKVQQIKPEIQNDIKSKRLEFQEEHLSVNRSAQPILVNNKQDVDAILPKDGLSVRKAVIESDRSKKYWGYFLGALAIIVFGLFFSYRKQFRCEK
jgi:hypothetical protein